MYSIFLVDDEEIELEMMRDIIRWNEMGIYVVGTAVNGKDAIEKIQVIQPDIILTDVQMPIMNGIELAKLVNEQFDWMKIVFLTGHDEFAYVKSALNVGAVGYLLKPLDLEEIVIVMDKVKEKCEEVHLKNTSIQVTKAHIIKELMYEKSKERKDNLVNSFYRLERRIAPTSFTLVLCSIDDDHLQELEIFIDDAIIQLSAFTDQFCKESSIHGTYISLKEGELAILIDAEQRNIDRDLWGRLLQAIQQTLPFTVTIAVSERYDELINIYSLYEHTKKVQSEQFYSGYGNVIYASDIQVNFDSDQIPPFSEGELFEAVKELHEDQIVPILHEYFLRLVRLRIRKKYIYDWAIDLIDRLNEQIRIQNADANAGTRTDLYHSIYDCKTIQEIEEAVTQTLKHTIDSLKDRFTDKNLKLVHQVSSIIQNTYHEQITITSLSSQVYLSPNYMRSIFKEKTGTTIHDYLTKIRLEKAKEMLSDPSLKVQDIAQKVGYESTSYFISLFLKSQGVTPNEYRKNL